ncbi:histone-lysine N-methyltransferase SETMAR [Trichonephila clavipes]|nr:histone-lysine N-methyltransferase SETMAR [Trichonephila clavipes]
MHRCPTRWVFSGNGARTRDKASHDPIPVPLGYRGHLAFIRRRLCCVVGETGKAIQHKHPSLANRKDVILHHDNARLEVIRNTAYEIEDLVWETLPEPAYTPDIAPSDYQLFRFLQNFLDGN